MQLKFSPEQVEWLLSVTGTTSAQEAVDMFADAMKKENIEPTKIMMYIRLMMRKSLSSGVK